MWERLRTMPNRTSRCFLLPKLGSKYIEAEVCSQATEQQTDICNRATTMFLYGVRFAHVLSDTEVCDRLL